MDNDDLESLASSSFFDKRQSNVCDTDDVSFSSQPPSKINPIIYVRKPSLSARGSSENLSDSRKKDDYHVNKLDITSIGKRFSHLLPFSFRSHDNLTRLVKKDSEELSDADFIYQNTKSLPPSPLGTPASTPQSSPQLRRNQMSVDGEKIKEENLNSLPWYYTGIFATTPVNKELESYSKEKLKQVTVTNPETKSASNPHPVKYKTCYFHRDSPNPQQKFSFSNRDMNFLAPTSM